jgi:hypothetical protein
MSQPNPYEAPQSELASRRARQEEEVPSSFPAPVAKLFQTQCVSTVALGLFRGLNVLSGYETLFGLLQFYLGVSIGVMSFLLIMAASHYQLVWLMLVEIFVFALPLLSYGLWLLEQK